MRRHVLVGVPEVAGELLQRLHGHPVAAEAAVALDVDRPHVPVRRADDVVGRIRAGQDRDHGLSRVLGKARGLDPRVVDERVRLVAAHALDVSGGHVRVVELRIVGTRQHAEQPVVLADGGPGAVVAGLEEARGARPIVVADHLDRVADVDVEDVVTAVVAAEAHPDDLGTRRAVGVPALVALEARTRHAVADLETAVVAGVKAGGPRRSPRRPAECGCAPPGRSRRSAPRPRAARTSPRRRGHSSAWAGSRPRGRTAPRTAPAPDPDRAQPPEQAPSAGCAGLLARRRRRRLWSRAGRQTGDRFGEAPRRSPYISSATSFFAFDSSDCTLRFRYLLSCRS